jgi:hypothetical protein
LIVVFVPYRKPVIVLEATKEEVGIMATDSTAAATHTSSIPPGLLAGDFEACWSALTKDMQFAHHFATVKEALAFFRGPSHGLTIQQLATVITGLQRLTGERRSGSFGQAS